MWLYFLQLVLDTLFCEPPHYGYDLWNEGIDIQFTVQQSERNAGEKILQYLIDHGYSVSTGSHQPVLKTKREKTILSLGVHSVAPDCIKNNIVSEEYVEKMLCGLYELEEDPQYLPRYNEVYQMRIKKS